MAGQTWTNLSQGMSHSRVISMAIDPAYPATVYAGTKGDAVYKSYDGGQRWVSQRAGLDDATISSVVNQFVFDPADNQHLFARRRWGCLKPRMPANSWTKRMDGMKEVLMVVTLGLDPTRPSVLYAGTSGGVYKSVDQAGHWEKVNNGLVSPAIIKSSRALNVTAVLVDPHEPDTVYAATLEGLYKSTDAAASGCVSASPYRTKCCFRWSWIGREGRDLPGWPGRHPPERRRREHMDHAE